MRLVSQEKCTGCMACMQCCPKNAIKITRGESYDQPYIDETLCVSCGLCQKVCPVLTSRSGMQAGISVYGAYAKDDTIRLKSSSGGMFFLLARAVLQEHGVVFGAAFDDAMQVKCRKITCEEDIDLLCRSKYVQSSIGSTFIEAMGELEKGKRVLFCGTPCQIHGLKAFLGREYDSLLTVDFICHGVPSPAAWRSYLSYRESGVGAKATNCNFRFKENGWKKYCIQIKFENGTTYTNSFSVDPYCTAFLQNLILRESCYSCMAKGNYASDLTLADFWGVDRFCPEIFNVTGTSLVIINTTRGQDLFRQVNAELVSLQTDMESVKKSNPSYNKSVSMPKIRAHFLREMKKHSFMMAYERWCGDSLAAKVRRKLCR